MTKTALLLRELVALPSVNPAFLPEGDPQAGEQRVVLFLEEHARRAGLEVFRQAVAPGRPNLVVRLAPRGACRHRVLLAPHLDTVAPVSPAQLVPRVRHGRLYGRGACDTKGSVAAMFTALLNCTAARRRPTQTEIIFAGLADEEAEQLGSRQLAASGEKADLAIVGEPTRLQVVTAHKGALWMRILTRGKAAHGARPELGRSAILAMLKLVGALETQYAAVLAFRRHPLLGQATINVGVIRGGSQPNIVPDWCEIEVDRRTLPGEDEAAVRREILRVASAAGVRVALSKARKTVCPALETDPGLPLVKKLMAVTGQKDPAGADFFCDAAILSAGGTPSVVYGPGDIAQAHTAEEWVSLKEVELAARRLTAFLLALP